MFVYHSRGSLLTVWNLLDIMKIKRRITIFFLIFLLMTFAFVDAYLINNIFSSLFGLPNKTVLYLILASLIGLLVYYLLTVFSYGSVTDSEINHHKSSSLKEALQNIVVATGITEPQIKIIEHSVPTVFTVDAVLKPPTIYVTSTMLNVADKRELEAIIAHEVSHIQSGFTKDFLLIQHLLLILHLLGFLLLLVVLAALNFNFFILWLFIAAMLVFQSFEDKFKQIPFPLITIISFINPPYILVNLVAYIIYYSLISNEDLYADMQAVRITRYPKPLYTILTKLQSFHGFTHSLPSKFLPLYFTGEHTYPLSHPLPQIQPTIEERLLLIEEIDSTIKTISASKLSETAIHEESIKCPLCSYTLNKTVVKNNVGTDLVLDYCSRCGSVWFDYFELWYVADLLSLQMKIQNYYSDKLVHKVFLCPHCNNQLVIVKEPMIPQDIELYRCLICKGNWLQHKDLIKYSNFKQDKAHLSSL